MMLFSFRICNAKDTKFDNETDWENFGITHSIMLMASIELTEK